MDTLKDLKGDTNLFGKQLEEIFCKYRYQILFTKTEMHWEDKEEDRGVKYRRTN